MDTQEDRVELTYLEESEVMVLCIQPLERRVVICSAGTADQFDPGEDGDGWHTLLIHEGVWGSAEVVADDGEVHDLRKWLAEGGGHELIVTICEAFEEDTGSGYEWLQRLQDLLHPPRWYTMIVSFED